MPTKATPAHERPDWPTQLREIRKLFKGDLCRDYRGGDKGNPADIFCRTCGRSQTIHWLRALYEALVATEKPAAAAQLAADIALVEALHAEPSNRERYQALKQVRDVLASQ